MKEKRRIEVVAALIEREGKILIARRGEHDSFSGKWEFPGGKVRRGEDDQIALARELREELGVDAQVGGHFMSLEHEYDTVTVHLRLYECSLRNGDMPRSLQHAEILWAAPDELFHYDFLEADRPVRAKILQGAG